MKKQSANDCLTALLILIVFTPLLCFMHGLTLMVLWQWFVVRTFHAPQLSIPQALGITLIASLLCERDKSKQKSEESASWQMIEHVLVRLVACGLALLIGRIYLAFM